jgi:hypothetical protein
MERMYNLLVKTYYMLMKHKYHAAPTNTMFFAVRSPYSILKKYSVLTVFLQQAHLIIFTSIMWGIQWHSWLRHRATNWNVAGSIPDIVI